MSDDDLIRRGDALNAVQGWTYCCNAEDAIAALPAVTAPQGVDADDDMVSEQRIKYEKLCAQISVGKASQQDAVDAIVQLCRDNERLAVLAGKARAALAPAQPAPSEWNAAIRAAAEVCTRISTDPLTKAGGDHAPWMKAAAEDCARYVIALLKEEPK